MKDFLAILGKALLWAAGVSAAVFVVALIGPAMLGGPGSHQAFILAFLLAPAAFPLVLLAAIALQYRRAGRFGAVGRAAYAIALAVMLVPAAMSVYFVASFDIKLDFAGMSREERFRNAAALTEEERRLRESTHFDLRVRVENPRFPPVYTGVLVTDLASTGLFRTVNESTSPETADLVASVTGSYYGDKQGASFTLRRADGKGGAIQLKVYYIVGGFGARLVDHPQYLDRLAVETIRAVETLQAAAP